MLRKINSKSISYQIVIFIFSFILLIMLSSILMTRFLMSKVMANNARSYILSVAQENINRIDGKLTRIQTLAQNLRYVVQNNLLEKTQVDSMVARLLSVNPEIMSCGIAYVPEHTHGRDSFVLCKIRNRVDKVDLSLDTYPYQDWFQIPYLAGEARWSEPWYDNDGSRRLVSSYSIPIFEGDGVSGIVRLDIDLTTMQHLVMPAEEKQLGFMFVISAVGTVVTHPADSLVMNYTIFSFAEAYNDKQLREIGRDMIHGKTGFVRMKPNSYNPNNWIAYAPLKSNGWSLGVVVAHKDIFKDLNLLLLIQTLVSVLGFLLLSGVILAKLLQVNKPLKALTDSAIHIGKGDFDTPMPQNNSFYEISLLTSSFDTMRQSLKNYIENLKRTTEEKNRILGEVNFASTIQRNLIPKNSAQSDTIDPLRIYGILQPAGEIGGDLYDYFPINDRTYCFAIADVSGKGIAAAMTMTIVSTYIRAKASYHENPDTLLNDLNRFLCSSSTESNFVTMILGMIDLHTGIMRYSNAGHVPLFIRKSDRSYNKYPETHSTALGVFDNLKIGFDTVRLDLGDELILFTDGITEAMTVSESFFGIERLEEIIRNLQNPHAETTAKAILSGARKFSDTRDQYDDITILIIDFLHPLQTIRSK